MTDDEKIEWNYRYQERLGILCGDAIPTAEQIKIATEEANAAVEKLRVQNEQA